MDEEERERKEGKLAGRCGGVQALCYVDVFGEGQKKRAREKRKGRGKPAGQQLAV